MVENVENKNRHVPPNNGKRLRGGVYSQETSKTFKPPRANIDVTNATVVGGHIFRNLRQRITVRALCFLASSFLGTRPSDPPVGGVLL